MSRPALVIGMSGVRGRDVRILIADDHYAVRESVRQVLEYAGMQVVCEADNGFDAVQQCRRLCPDVVILDITMPQLNGFEAARQIRRVSPATRIVFLSGHTTEACAGEAFRVGGLAYVCKQHAAVALLEAVEVVLEGGIYLSGGSDIAA